MPRQNLTARTLPSAVAEALRKLGENLALARVRRGLRQADLAKRTGLALGTIARAEKGSPTTAVSVYFTLLWAMGLEREFLDLASPDRDKEGKTRERARAPQRARRSDDLDADF